MAKKKKFFNPELNTYANYTEVWVPEKVKVKDEKELLVTNHYWRDKNGELWGDFKNPMENVYRSFAVYRKRKGYLSPKKIKKIRQNLKLSVRQFAQELGISPSTLTQIENNHRIQTKYQDNLFRIARKFPSYFKDEISPKKCSFLGKNDYKSKNNYYESPKSNSKDVVYTNILKEAA